MSSEQQSYYENFATQPSRWAHDDPTICGCHGSGYFLSEVDTLHKCPIHFTLGQQHPEDPTPPHEYALSILVCFFAQCHAPARPSSTDSDDDIPF